MDVGLSIIQLVMCMPELKEYQKRCLHCGVVIPANDYEHERNCSRNPKNKK